MTTTTKPPATSAGVLPQLRQLAAASRQATELQWERERVEHLARERNKAVTDATHSVKCRFPNTLDKLLSEGRIGFTGYPSLDVGEAALPVGPCAVAYLGEGVWLHHAEVRDSYSMLRGRPTLLIPCACGRYREVSVDDEYALADALERMDTNRDTCPGTCTPCGGPSGDDTDDKE